MSLCISDQLNLYSNLYCNCPMIWDCAAVIIFVIDYVLIYGSDIFTVQVNYAYWTAILVSMQR
jgi:hypothetical protein